MPGVPEAKVLRAFKVLYFLKGLVRSRRKMLEVLCSIEWECLCCTRYLIMRAQGLLTLYVTDTQAKIFAPCLASNWIFFVVVVSQSFSRVF